MISQNDVKGFNRRLFEVWKSNRRFMKDKKGKKLPLYLSPCYISDNLRTNSCKLIIIGLNPSYSHGNWKKVLKQTIPQGQKVSIQLRNLQNFLNNPASSKDMKNKKIDNYCKFKEDGPNIIDLIYLDSLASDKSEGVQYFKKMHELAEDVLKLEKSEWKHLDIFYYRETKQNKVKDLIEKNEPFFKAQATITKKIITKIEPSMILVSNAFAGEKFREMFSGNSEKFFKKYPIQEDIGTHLVKIGKGKPVPVFFSGMLSGQRALDLGSYERLKWHIQAVFKGKSMK